jgi:hypothetical protein
MRAAVNNGFGTGETQPFRLSDLSDPLRSPSIRAFLASLEKKQQVICLVFDQFEELYSRSDLFDVFELAQRLFLSATAARSNLVLGFAWKSDSTVQQTHPAYHMWHNLADHRIEIKLGGFSHAEASKAISIFERELGEKLLPKLKRQLIENSQGFPWLLKKLCIHIYEQVHAGESQSQLVDKALDVESLFERDLQRLTAPEKTCLRLIAERTPADWFDVLETSGPEVIRALVDKRLLVRSGNRLNLYWDIFREYVLTSKVPSIPLTYMPSSPSIRSALMVAQHLDPETPCTYAQLSRLTNLRENTVDNLIRDLVMFGIAEGGQSEALLHKRMPSSDPESVLKQLRREFKSHALVLGLAKRGITRFTQDDIITILKGINPAAGHQERTWKVYADRMKQWLSATGFIESTEGVSAFKDQGDINAHFIKVPVGYYRQDNLFIGDTSPLRTVQALEYLISGPPRSWAELKAAGFRNAATVLRTLRIIVNVSGEYRISQSLEPMTQSAAEIVWNKASVQPIMSKLVEHLRQHPTASGTSLGILVNDEYQRNWASSSMIRIGNSLRQWAVWIMNGLDGGDVPPPPGAHGRIHSVSSDQPSLFRQNDQSN